MRSSSPVDHLSPAFPGRAAWGTAARLRAWQVEALEAYRACDQRDFLAVATPGAGKTTFALRVATDLMAARTVRQVIVVTPTEHLKVQWADAAAKVGLHLDPGLGGASAWPLAPVPGDGGHVRRGCRGGARLRGPDREHSALW